MSLKSTPQPLFFPITGGLGTTDIGTLGGNPIFFPGQTTQIRQAPGADGGDPSSAAIAPDGMVEFGTGIVQLSTTPALISHVGGITFGQSLLWSNQTTAALGVAGVGALGSSRFGNGMSAAEIPQLIPAGDIYGNSLGQPSIYSTETSGAVNSIIAMDGNVTVPFTYSGGAYQAQDFSLDTLSYDTTNDHFFLTDTAGDVIEFYGFGSATPAAQRGQFKLISDSAGNAAAASYDSSGRLNEVDLIPSGGTTVDQYLYTYGSSTSQLVTNVALYRLVNGTMTTDPVQQVDYSYYSGYGWWSDDFLGTFSASGYGSVGDLEFAGVADGSGAIFDTTYFRYDSGVEVKYIDDGASLEEYPIFEESGVTQMFSNASFARLVAANGGSVAAAVSSSYADAAPYADVNLNYGGPNGTWVTGLGTGMGSVSYDYSFHAATDGYDNWRVETTETANDGGAIKTFSNYDGETLVEDIFVPVSTGSSSGQHLVTAYQYSTTGQLTETAQPSAVSTYDTSDDLGITLNSTGLVEWTDYYAETDFTTTWITSGTTSTSDGGGVAGYVEDHRLENGSSATFALQDYIRYYNVSVANTIDGFAVNVAVAPVAATTVYTNVNSGLSGATGGETTSHTYYFNPSSVSIEQDTETLPTVTDEYGSSSATDTTTTVFNLQGLPVWEQDARGILTYRTFDLATGALTKLIDDVNTGDSSEFSGLPSGWSNTSGLNLITTVGIDDLGRTVQIIDPTLDASFVRYQDDLHEVRVYTGWKADSSRTSFSIPSGETLPPTQVTIDDLTFVDPTSSDGESYSESFTMSATPHVPSSGAAPDGTEAINDLQSLSVSITGKSGQQIESDDYYDFTGLDLNSADSATSGLISSAGAFIHLSSSHYLPGTAWDPSSASTAANYYATTYNNNSIDTTITTDPNGNVTALTLDALGRTKSVSIGGNTVASYTYDADGNLTQVIEYAGSSSAPDRITQRLYDWRDREIAEKSGIILTTGGSENLSAESADTSGVMPVTRLTLNNLGDVTEQDVYAGNGYALSSFSSGGPSGMLREKTTYAYDAEDRLQSVSVYDVSQTSGSITSGNTETTSELFDADGNVVQVTDPMSNVTSYSFDGLNRLTSQTAPDPDGAGPLTSPVTIYGYDAASNLTSIEDPNLHTTTYSYDAAYRLTEIQQPSVTILPASATSTSGTTTATPTTSYGYGSDGLLSSTTDPNDNTTTYNRDALGRIVQIVQPAAELLQSGSTSVDTTATSASGTPTTSYEYDGNSNITAIVDPNGGRTEYDYTPLNLVSEVRLPTPGMADDAHGPTTDYDYDFLGDLVSERTTDGTTDYAYNTLGENTQIVQPPIDVLQSGASLPVYSQSPTSSFTYNVFGQVASTTDPNASYSSGYSTQYIYNSFGALKSVVQPNPTGGTGAGPTTTYVYNKDNELISVTDPLSNTTDYGYYDNQLLHTITTPNPSTGSLTSGELTTTYAYDAASNLTSVTDPMGYVTSYSYDARNMLSQVVEANPTTSSSTTGPTITYYRDAVGNERAMTDPDGNTTYFNFNALNQLTSQSESVAVSRTGTTETDVTATTSYLHDAEGNLTRKTDADGNVTDYAVNYLGQTSEEAWLNSSGTLTNTIDYSYYGDALLETATDTYQNTTGTNYSTTTADNSQYSFAYNALGWLTTVNNNGGYSSGMPSAPAVTLTAQYDLNGNRTALSATINWSYNDFQDRFSYDRLNRQTQITQQGVIDGNAVDVKAVGLNYDAASRLTGIFEGSSLSTNPVAQASFNYDHANRLTELTWSGYGGGVASPVTYEDFSLRYDNDSRVTGIGNSVHPDENVSNVYDHDWQLLQVDRPNPYGGSYGGGYGGGGDGYGGGGGGSGSLETDYSWTANGNPSGYVIGEGNRLLSDGVYNYTYDNDGNIIKRVAIGSGAETDYSWDNRDRLTAVDDFTGTGTSRVQMRDVSYVYDMFDRLIDETVTAYSGGSPVTSSITSTEFVFDFPSPLAGEGSGVRGQGGNALLEFDGTGALTDRFLWGPDVDQLLADESFSPTTSGEMPTAAGTTYWAVTDNQGSVRDAVTAADGVVSHIVYDSFGNITGGANPILFGYTGGYFDPLTGLIHEGERWYSPRMMRFLSPDPSGLGPDSNPYRYVGNSTPNFIDPTWALGGSSRQPRSRLG